MDSASRSEPATIFRACSSFSRIRSTPLSCNKSEGPVVHPGQTFVAEVGIDHEVLLGRDPVECGELAGGWADRIHQTDGHKRLGLDPRGEVLDVDVSELHEDLVLSLVSWVVATEPGLQLIVGIPREAHLPKSSIVA